MGMVASAATILFMSGNTRVCGKNSYMLIHAVSSSHGALFTTFEEIKTNFNNDQIVMNQFINFYNEHTKIPPNVLADCMIKDIYFTYNDCLKYGIHTAN